MRRVIAVLMFVFLLCLTSIAGAEGRVLPEDFVVRGVALGEAADDAAIQKTFGAQLFDTQ